MENKNGKKGKTMKKREKLAKINGKNKEMGKWINMD